MVENIAILLVGSHDFMFVGGGSDLNHIQQLILVNTLCGCWISPKDSWNHAIFACWASHSLTVGQPIFLQIVQAHPILNTLNPHSITSAAFIRAHHLLIFHLSDSPSLFCCFVASPSQSCPQFLFPVSQFLTFCSSTRFPGVVDLLSLSCCPLSFEFFAPLSIYGLALIECFCLLFSLFFLAFWVAFDCD